MKPYLKNTQHKTGLAALAQVIQSLPSKHAVLSSNPSTAKKENNVKISI
jgi:hypothetical protein